MLLENLNEGATVENSYGVKIDFDTVVNLMDDDIREEVHDELAPCSNQDFYDRYVQIWNERHPNEPLDAPGGIESANPQY